MCEGLQVGDKVRVETGTQIMEIEKIGDFPPPAVGAGKNKAKCFWYDKNGVKRWRLFDCERLVKIEE